LPLGRRTPTTSEVDLRALSSGAAIDIYAPIKIANFAVTCQRRREMDNVAALTATKQKMLQLEGKV